MPKRSYIAYIGLLCLLVAIAAGCSQPQKKPLDNTQDAINAINSDPALMAKAMSAPETRDSMIQIMTSDQMQTAMVEMMKNPEMQKNMTQMMSRPEMREAMAKMMSDPAMRQAMSDMMQDPAMREKYPDMMKDPHHNQGMMKPGNQPTSQ